MGRKKKRSRQVKIWCFYCNREFNNEKVLTDHQKARHFRCIECGKRLLTINGLQVHMEQVHKMKLKKVPNAKDGRDNPEVEVYGMSGIPAEFLGSHGGNPQAAKRQRNAAAPVAPPAAMPPYGMPMMPPRGLPPGMPPYGMPPRGMPPGMPPYGMPPPGMPPRGMPPMGMPPMGMPPMGMPPPGFPPAAPVAALPPLTATPTTPKPAATAAAAAAPAAAGAGAGAGAGASAGTAAPEAPINVGPNAVLVHPPSQKLSLEEIRAALPRYRYDEKQTAAAAAAADAIKALH